MLRIISISIISLCSFFPLHKFVSQYFVNDANMGMILSVVLALIVLPTLIGKLWRAKPNMEFMLVDHQDPLMMEQVEIAKRQLDRVLTALEKGREQVYLKFPYEFDEQLEHIWGIAHSFNNDQIIVSMSTEFADLVESELGERFTIPLSSVEDWMLVNAEGEIKGGYTILAKAQIYQRDFGPLTKYYAQDLQRYVDFSWVPETASFNPFKAFAFFLLVGVAGWSFSQPENQKLVKDLLSFTTKYDDRCLAGECDSFDYQHGFTELAHYEYWKDAIYLDGIEIDERVNSREQNLELLQQGQYIELDEYMSKYHQLYLDGRLKEWGYRKIVYSVGWNKINYIENIDKWIVATGSAYAYQAKAITLQNIAWKFRGTKLLKDTPSDARKQFDRYLRMSYKPITQALEKLDTLTVIYEERFELGALGSEFEDQFEPWLAQVEKKVPQAFYPRVGLMRALLPRWGGSYKEMRQLAIRSLIFIDLNPEFRNLLGFEWFDRSRRLSEKGNYIFALNAIDKAIFHGERVDWLERKGHIQMKLNHLEGAKTSYSRALKINPDREFSQQILLYIEHKIKEQGD